MPEAREILLWLHWGAENEIIVFLINEGAMAAKYLIL